MPRKRLPYVQRETVKGHSYWYFRRHRGGPRVRLPDQYASPEFMAAYHAALTGEKTPPPSKAESGTLQWLVDQYKRSLAFAALGPTTRRNRDRLMQAICETENAKKRKAGAMPLSAISRATIEDGMARRAEKGPEAANSFLKTMRALLEFAVTIRAVKTNPAKDVKMLAGSVDGFAVWTPEDVAAFEARHPVGTKARLAMDLMLYTGLRKSDVVRVGPEHVRDGILELRPMKTARSSGVMVTMTLHPRVAASIKAAPIGETHFLVTEFGRPFTANGFGNWFRKRCDEAGVSKSAHGLRKAGATRLAEGGATTHQLMAYFGWKTTKEAERYTGTADRRRMGLDASKLWRDVPNDDNVFGE